MTVRRDRPAYQSMTNRRLLSAPLLRPAAAMLNSLNKQAKIFPRLLLEVANMRVSRFHEPLLSTTRTARMTACCAAIHGPVRRRHHRRRGWQPRTYVSRPERVAAVIEHLAESVAERASHRFRTRSSAASIIPRPGRQTGIGTRPLGDGETLSVCTPLAPATGRDRTGVRGRKPATAGWPPARGPWNGVVASASPATFLSPPQANGRHCRTGKACCVAAGWRDPADRVSGQSSWLDEAVCLGEQIQLPEAIRTSRGDPSITWPTTHPRIAGHHPVLAAPAQERQWTHRVR